MAGSTKRKERRAQRTKADIAEAQARRNRGSIALTLYADHCQPKRGVDVFLRGEKCRIVISNTDTKAKTRVGTSHGYWLSLPLDHALHSVRFDRHGAIY